LLRSSGTPRTFAKTLPAAFLILLTVIFFFPVCFQGKTFYAFDTLLEVLPWSALAPGYRPYNPLINDPVNVFYPAYHFYFNHIKELAYPLWDPLIFCGRPFPSGVYPMNNPLVFAFNLVLPLTTAHDAVLGLHLFAAGLFMFLYLKEIRLKALAALAGAVAWMFNGHVMVWFEFEHLPIMAATLPAALLYLHRWLQTGRRLHCLVFTAAVCLSITAGYSHVLIYELIFIGIYFLLLLYNAQKEDSLRQLINGRFAVHLGISIALGVCISANFLTSSLTLLDDAQREEIPFSDLHRKTGRLPAKYLTTLIFPDFYGNPAGEGVVFTPREDKAQIYNNYTELCIYAGIVPLFLILVCLVHLGKRRFALFYLSTAVVTLAMAMGSVLYYPLAKWVIGLSYSSPTRILYLCGFSMAVLAAIGADLLLAHAERKTKVFTLSLWAVLLLTAIALAFFAQTEPGAKWAAGSIDEAHWQHDFQILSRHFALTSSAVFTPLLFAGVSFFLLCAALLAKTDHRRSRYIALSILILAVDLISFGRHYNTTTPTELAYPPTGAIRFLQQDESAFRVVNIGFFLHNFLIPFGIQDIGGYTSFYPKRYGEYLHLSQQGPAAPLPDRYYRWTMFHRYGSPLLNLLHTKYVLTSPSEKPDTADLKPVYQGEIQVFENLSAFPRAFIVHDYQLCPDRQSAFEAIGSYRQADFASRVVLESPPPAPYSNKDPMPAEAARARVERIAVGTNRVEIELETDRKGFLVLSDSYHPHWQATVDGKAVEILRANYIMQAIPVPQGRHRVLLQFRSRPLAAGIILTAVGWLVLAVLLGSCRFTKKQPNQSPAHDADPIDKQRYPAG
jgi:hypothetical protein